MKKLYIYIYIYIYLFKKQNKKLEIVFHLLNKFISFIQARQMEFKWSLVTFFFFSVKRWQYISRYAALWSILVRKLMATEFSFLFITFVNIN